MDHLLRRLPRPDPKASFAVERGTYGLNALEDTLLAMLADFRQQRILGLGSLVACAEGLDDIKEIEALPLGTRDNILLLR